MCVTCVRWGGGGHMVLVRILGRAFDASQPGSDGRILGGGRESPQQRRRLHGSRATRHGTVCGGRGASSDRCGDPWRGRNRRTLGVHHRVHSSQRLRGDPNVLCGAAEQSIIFVCLLIFILFLLFFKHGQLAGAHRGEIVMPSRQSNHGSG